MFSNTSAAQSVKGCNKTMSDVSTPRKLPLKLARNVLLVSSTLALTACGAIGEKMPWHKPDPVDYALISTNLVDAISQYPKLSPLLATVQITKPENAFERHVHEEMTEQGFKLEQVGEGQGANGVNTDIRRIDVDAAPLYVLSIGEISAERRFDRVDGQTVPLSELVLRGGDGRSVKLNDSDLFNDFDSAYSTVAFKPYEGLEIEDVLSPGAAGTESKSTDKETPSFVKQNIYDTMTSNFADMYTEYEDVERQILVFPNDSLRLGETNKQIIEDYVSKMNTETDVLSVIGCSHGNTEIANGNSLLALGRANRVKEAFLFSGIEHDSVMEEGCWAPRTFDEVMPNRGVVLTLKRRKPS